MCRIIDEVFGRHDALGGLSIWQENDPDEEIWECYTLGIQEGDIVCTTGITDQGKELDDKS